MAKRSVVALRELLNAGHELRYVDIRDKLGLGSTRQAMRLIDKLRVEGLPILERKVGKAKEFYLDEKDQTKEVAFHFDEEEMLALAVAAEAAKAALKGTPLHFPIFRAFRKLLDNLAPHAVTFEMEDLSGQYIFNTNPLNHIDLGIFKTLQLAIKEQQTVRIDYHTASTNTYSEGRKVDPLAIALPGKSWLLVAYCHRSHKIKDFAIAAISDIDISHTSYFDLPEGFEPQTYFASRFGSVEDNHVHHIRLLVEADRAAYFKRKDYHRTQIIEKEHDDGSIEVSFDASGLDEVRSFVQSWGVGVTVLSPPELIARVAEEASKLKERYSE